MLREIIAKIAYRVERKWIRYIHAKFGKELEQIFRTSFKALKETKERKKERKD